MQLVDGVVQLLAEPSYGHWDAVGWFVLLTGLLLAGLCCRSEPAAAAWVGLFVFGVVSLALIVTGRWFFLDTSRSFSSRYLSLAAMAWIGWFGMAISLVTGRLSAKVSVGILAASVSLGAGFTGSETTSELAVSVAGNENLSVTIRFGLEDGIRNVFGVPMPDVAGRLAQRDDYPFSGNFTNDCGLHADEHELVERSSGPIANADETAPEPALANQNGISFAVLLPPELGEIECVVALNQSSRIVGAGILVESSPDWAPARRYEMIAEREHETYSTYVVLTSGEVGSVGPPTD